MWTQHHCTTPALLPRPSPARRTYRGDPPPTAPAASAAPPSASWTPSEGGLAPSRAESIKALQANLTELVRVFPGGKCCVLMSPSPPCV
uniref:Uncharacterized protein n=1 Tax=Knipowitschia caucasica TaxID=637954 RepID=A0AAV2JJG9_KNICA